MTRLHDTLARRAAASAGITIQGLSHVLGCSHSQASQYHRGAAPLSTLRVQVCLYLAREHEGPGLGDVADGWIERLVGEARGLFPDKRLRANRDCDTIGGPAGTPPLPG